MSSRRRHLNLSRRGGAGGVIYYERWLDGERVKFSTGTSDWTEAAAVRDLYESRRGQRRAGEDSTRPASTPPAKWHTGVYFIRSHDEVKIGVSRRNVVQRVAGLVSYLGGGARVLGYLPGETPRREREIHRLWGSIRVRGEWFRASEDLLNWVGSLQDLQPVPGFKNDWWGGMVPRERRPAELGGVVAPAAWVARLPLVRQGA